MNCTKNSSIETSICSDSNGQLTLIIVLSLSLSLVVIVTIILIIIVYRKYRPNIKSGEKKKPENIEKEEIPRTFIDKIDEDKSSNSKIGFNNSLVNQRFQINYNHISLINSTNSLKKSDIQKNEVLGLIDNKKIKSPHNEIQQSNIKLRPEWKNSVDSSKFGSNELKFRTSSLFEGGIRFSKTRNLFSPSKKTQNETKGKYLSKLDGDFYFDYASKISKPKNKNMSPIIRAKEIRDFVFR